MVCGILRTCSLRRRQLLPIALLVELPGLFDTVQALIRNSFPELETLIALGLFEDIQNIASHRDFGTSPFRRWLGPLSLVVTDAINNCQE